MQVNSQETISTIKKNSIKTSGWEHNLQPAKSKRKTEESRFLRGNFVKFCFKKHQFQTTNILNISLCLLILPILVKWRTIEKIEMILRLDEALSNLI